MKNKISSRNTITYILREKAEFFWEEEENQGDTPRPRVLKPINCTKIA